MQKQSQKNPFVNIGIPSPGVWPTQPPPQNPLELMIKIPTSKGQLFLVLMPSRNTKVKGNFLGTGLQTEGACYVLLCKNQGGPTKNLPFYYLVKIAMYPPWTAKAPEKWMVGRQTYWEGKLFRG